MNKKIFALVIITIMIGLVLSACTRSATSKSPTDATATSEIPFPVGTLDTSARVTEIVQQTQNAAATPSVPTVQVPQVSTPVVIPTTAGLPTLVLQPTATSVPVKVPTLSRPETYTIQFGEWPICIARRYNLDLNGLLEANNLNMNSSPEPGTVLNIPATGTWASGERALKAHPADYTVVSGDTVNSIACEFGDVDPLAIAAANSLSSPYTLSAGSVIKIP
ncbi:MAG: LysM peptidoglycan-binding domain-containing protein [Bellilinea sp.]